MADRIGHVRPGRRLAIEPPAEGTGWRVASSGGLCCRQRSDGTVEAWSDIPCKGTVVLERRLGDRSSETFSVDVVVSSPPRVRDARTFAGIPVRLDPGQGDWTVVDDGGMVWTRDGKGFSVTAGEPGQRSFLVASGPDSAIRFDLDVKEPRRVLLETRARVPVSFEIAANYTTGYSWTVTDGGGLRYASEYVQRRTDPMVCGAGGKVVVEMAADSPGRYVLRMKHARIWEDCPIGACEAEVVVGPSARGGDVFLDGGKAIVELECDPEGDVRWTVSDPGSAVWEDMGVEKRSPVLGIQRFRVSSGSETGSLLSYRRSDGEVLDEEGFRIRIA